MKILASCTIEESKENTGKLVVPGESGESIDKVVLNVVVENGDKSILEDLNSNIMCVTFKSNIIEDCPDKYKDKVFNEIFIDDIGSLASYKGNIPVLVRVPKGYSNMKEVLGYCDMYPFVRFIGGNLLGIEGVRIGRYDSKGKLYPLYNGVYDNFLEVELSELSGVTEIVRKAKKKIEGGDGKPKKKKSSGSKKSGDSSGKPKVNKVSKRAKAFSNMFSGESEDF